MTVKYDDGQTKTHSMHNNVMRQEEQDPLPSLFMIQSERGVGDVDSELREDVLATELESDDVLMLVDIDIDLETGRALNKS